MISISVKTVLCVIVLSFVVFLVGGDEHNHNVSTYPHNLIWESKHLFVYQLLGCYFSIDMLPCF